MRVKSDEQLYKMTVKCNRYLHDIAVEANQEVTTSATKTQSRNTVTKVELFDHVAVVIPNLLTNSS